MRCIEGGVSVSCFREISYLFGSDLVPTLWMEEGSKGASKVCNLFFVFWEIWNEHNAHFEGIVVCV